MTRVRNRLKEILKEKGLTQSDLARAIGTDRSSVNRYAHGRTIPSFRTILQIAKVINE
ncbi:hypothetical protein HKBW3S42_02518, partial [Candidatus Hakubella thermalkaliphila]